MLTANCHPPIWGREKMTKLVAKLEDGKQQPLPHPAESSFPGANSWSFSAIPTQTSHVCARFRTSVEPNALKTSPIHALGKEDEVLTKE